GTGLVITNAGNVGIGTTSPSQKLHVEGQCVTGDTLLPIVTSQKPEERSEYDATNFIGDNGDYSQNTPAILSSSHLTNFDQSAIFSQTCEMATTPTREIQTVLVPIKDIKGGEYVLSLNEETGKIEPHQIKGLLDMGVQPVYRLTTEDGRTIRTTGNHPYLTSEGWKKVVYLKEGEEIAVVSMSSNSSIDISPVANQSDQNFSLQPVENYTVISDSESVNLTGNSSQSFCKEKGVSRGKEGFNLFDDAFLNVQGKSAQIPLCMFGEAVGNHNPKRFLTEAEETQPEEREFSSFSKNTEERLSNSSDNSFKASVSRNNPTDSDLLSTKRTTPLRYSAGDERNFDNDTVSSLRNMEIIYQDYTTWQKIKSIEYVGEEQVYDIEVSGTHNFVAGHWIKAAKGTPPRWPKDSSDGEGIGGETG
ncbi:hypothetical protein GW853_03125, partial [Candidatus Kuenenbacteria bacterium]|nr:hypothetical protein [Candidatus Kuenenbacteria bacterium]